MRWPEQVSRRRRAVDALPDVLYLLRLRYKYSVRLKSVSCMLAGRMAWYQIVETGLYGCAPHLTPRAHTQLAVLRATNLNKGVNL